VSLGDFGTFQLANRVFGKQVAIFSLFSIALNWFYWFCMVRTFSNSLETVLFVWALVYWPFDSRDVSTRFKALCIAALAVLVRPSCGFVWIILGIQHLMMLKGFSSRTQFLLKQVVPVGIMAILISIGIDYLGYGGITFVPWNFIAFNVFQGGSEMYGTHPWHWYFSQGFPAMLGIFLPFVLLGTYLSRNIAFPSIILTVLFSYSLNAHKEFRFVLPALPIALILASFALTWLWNRSSKSKFGSRLWFCSTLTLVVTNLPAIYYFSQVHQRAPIDLIRYTESNSKNNNGSVSSIDFMLPCHTTPFQSYLHDCQLKIMMLECKPQFEGRKLVGTRANSETFRFLNSPQHFLASYYQNRTVPSHIAIFDEHYVLAKDFFFKNNYLMTDSFHFSHFDTSKRILVLENSKTRDS